MTPFSLYIFHCVVMSSPFRPTRWLGHPCAKATFRVWSALPPSQSVDFLEIHVEALADSCRSSQN
jgi:hypothetical protein